MDYANVATGSYLVVNDRPCKVVKLDKSPPGRHGKSRKRVTCADLITDKKIEAIFKKSSVIDVPLITKDTFKVVDIFNNTISFHKGSDVIAVNISNCDKEMYEKAENLFEKEKDLMAEVMHIKFNYFDSEYMRVLRVAKVKSK